MKIFDINYFKKFPFIRLNFDTFFSILFECIFIGVLAFFMETGLEYICYHVLADRGFLIGPFIPIYAIFCLIIIFRNKFFKNSIYTFFDYFGFIFFLSIALEEIIGLFCEHAYNAILWQYNDIPLTSPSGYTNNLISLLWALIGSLYIMYVIPFVNNLSYKFSRRVKITITSIFFFLLTIDLIVSFYLININHGYQDLYYHRANIDITLFLICVVAYLLILYLLLKKIYKSLIKYVAKFDYLFVISYVILVFFPICSCYSYIEKSTNSFINSLAQIGFILVAFLIYFTIGFIIVSLIKLVSKFILLHKEKEDRYYNKSIFKLCFFTFEVLFSFIFCLAGVIGANVSTVTKFSCGSGNNTLKIAAVSDIHYGTVGQVVNMNHLVNDINKLNPDVVFFLGDTIDRNVNKLDIYEFSSYMNKIESKYGIYNISGNHEYESNTDIAVSNWFGSINQLAPNFHYLCDEAINLDNKAIIVGRKDYVYGGRHYDRMPLKTIISRSGLSDLDLPLIVLDHQPQDYLVSYNANAVLQLSGHTHNGQLWPGDIILNLYEKILYNSYAYGLYNKDNYTCFITRGYGAWGFPMRTTGQSEVLDISFKY